MTLRLSIRLTLAITILIAMTSWSLTRAALISSTWDLAGGGSWNSAASWSPVGVPDNFANTYDVTVAPATPNSVITLNGDIDIQMLTLGANGIIRIDDAPPGGSSLGINAGPSTIDGDILINDQSAAAGGAFFFNVGDQEYTGSGRIIFNSPFDNTIGPIALSGGPIMTLGAGLTITTMPGGAHGGILAVLVNNGQVIADNGTIELASNVQGMTNNNIMRATNGGELVMGNVGQFDNSGGQIVIDPGSTLRWQLSTIAGGLITGGGLINVEGANNPTLDGTTDIPELNNVTVNIEPSAAANGTRKLILRGETINNATIRLNDTNAAATAGARLEAQGAATLSGTGHVFFDTGGENLIVEPTTGTHSLTLGSGQTVATTNALAVGDIQATLINNGLVSADAGTIMLSSRTKTNNGVMRAINGGTLVLNNIATLGIDNTGGTIQIDPGSTFEWIGSRILGGAIVGGGDVNINTLQPLLDGAGATLDVTVNINVTTASRRLTLVGAIINNGVIRLADTHATQQANLTVSGDVLINGTGAIVFDTNNIRNRIEGTGATPSVTFGPDHTLIVAAGNAGTITVPVINHGTLNIDGDVTFASTAMSLSNMPTGLIAGSGLIDMTGTVQPVINAGVVSPGAYGTGGAGVLSIGGRYEQQTGGELFIEIGGTTPGVHYDQLAILENNNEALLAGQLHVELINLFLPDAGDEFFVLTTFDTNGVLTAGEFDNAPRGNPYLTIPQGTFFVDYRDNAVVLTQFEAAPPPPQGQGVPEPATWGAMAAAVAMIARRSRAGRAGRATHG